MPENERQVKNFQSDIWLYAKGWYKKGNLIADMKRVFARTFQQEEDSIEECAIIDYLSDMVWKHAMHDNENSLSRLTSGMLEKTGTIEERIISSLLSSLRYVQTRGEKMEAVIYLDPPDASVLPLASPKSLWPWSKDRFEA